MRLRCSRASVFSYRSQRFVKCAPLTQAKTAAHFRERERRFGVKETAVPQRFLALEMRAVSEHIAIARRKNIVRARVFFPSQHFLAARGFVYPD
jgi:hypothetical protein